GRLVADGSGAKGSGALTMPSISGTIKLRHQTSIANNPKYDISKNVINDSLVVATGSAHDGSLFVCDGAQGDGCGLIDSVASGQLLASAGVNSLPAYTAAPSVTSITLSSFVQTPTITRGADSTLSIQVNAGARWVFDNSTGTLSGNAYAFVPNVDNT